VSQKTGWGDVVEEEEVIIVEGMVMMLSKGNGGKMFDSREGGAIMANTHLFSLSGSVLVLSLVKQASN